MGRKIAPGTSVVYHGGVVPYGYLLEDGGALDSVTNPQYAALFARIGTTYGGTGANNFLKPDSRRRTYVGSGGTGTGVLGNTRGSTGGTEIHSLLQAEIPAATVSGTTSGESAGHTHGYDYRTPSTANGGSAGGGDNDRGLNTVNNSTGGISNGHTHTWSGAISGGGQSHNNMQPSLVVTKMIKW